jgi:hypothetical protein
LPPCWLQPPPPAGSKRPRPGWRRLSADPWSRMDARHSISRLKNYLPPARYVTNHSRKRCARTSAACLFTSEVDHPYRRYRKRPNSVLSPDAFSVASATPRAQSIRWSQPAQLYVENMRKQEVSSVANVSGKRYVCAVCQSEMLVTRPGDGELSCCGQPMRLKAANSTSGQPSSPEEKSAKT